MRRTTKLATVCGRSVDDALYRAAVAAEQDGQFAAEMATWEAATVSDGVEFGSWDEVFDHFE